MARWEPMLEQVMRERAPRLLAYAAMLTGDDAEAHDVLQDALVRSFSRGRRFDHVNAAEAYVRRAIGSVVIDRSRKRRPVPRDPAEQAPEPAHSPDRDAVMDVRRALRELGAARARVHRAAVLRRPHGAADRRTAGHRGRHCEAVPVRRVGPDGGAVGDIGGLARATRRGAGDGPRNEGMALT